MIPAPLHQDRQNPEHQLGAESALPGFPRLGRHEQTLPSTVFGRGIRSIHLTPRELRDERRFTRGLLVLAVAAGFACRTGEVRFTRLTEVGGCRAAACGGAAVVG